MDTIELAGKTYQVDDEGFLSPDDFGEWKEEFAQAYANSEGIEGPLTEDHWKIIYYLRDYYQKLGIAPMVKKLCKDNGVDMKRFSALFTASPVKEACKLSGLPKPTGCV